MEDTRHPVVRELVKAWENFWTVTSLGKNCEACYTGKLRLPLFPYSERNHVSSSVTSRGCCGSCPHLEPGVGCKAKPLACAMYSCGSPMAMFLGWDKNTSGKITSYTHKLINELYFKYKTYFFEYGYKMELTDGAALLTPETLDLMQKHIRSLKIMGKRFSKLQPPRYSHFVPISALVGG